MKRCVIGFIGLLFIVITGCNKPYKNPTENEFQVSIHFTHKSGSSIMQLGTETVNPHGEKLTLTTFAYYISHFVATDTEGKRYNLPVEYFLIDEKLPVSKTIRFRLPEGSYQSLEWLIGVDSIRNVSGVQSGALDPANGMFWSWNTGYIFAKMEATSPVSTAALGNVTYHIGGFKVAESAIQKVVLRFPTQLVVNKTTTPTIEVEANSNSWFSGDSPLKIAETPFTMTPGALAQRISRNYAKMFTVVSIKE